MKNPIGTTFKKENIFLATVKFPIESNELNVSLKKHGCDVSTTPDGKKLIEIFKGAIKRLEIDIFYKDEKGYTRFLMEGNETFAGDGSDGKGILFNIVSAWDYYLENELCEMVNDKGEPVIADKLKDDENNPLRRYDYDYNLKCITKKN